jgi:hypothetical protein
MTAVPPFRLRGRGDTGADALAARLEVGAHETLFERGEVAAGRTERDRLLRVETMAAGHAAGRDPEDLAGNDRFAVQHHHPMHGSDELRRAVAPAHPSSDRQAVERCLHDAGKEPRGRLAGAGRAAEEELAFGILDARELVDADAAGLGESLRGTSRLAGGVEGGGNRRAPALDTLLRLLIEELRDGDRQAARREISLRRAVRQARGLEAGDEAVPECLAEGLEALRRHFLGADLDQEVVAVHLERLVMRTVVSAPRAGCGMRTVDSCRSSGNPFASRLAA